MGNSHLSPQQFLEPHELAQVRAMDFKGTIGDPDPVGRMEHWQSLFGGTSEARPYPEGDSPTARVGRLRESVRQEGVKEPLHINEWGNGDRVMMNGHHRAVAAFLEGKGAPARITVYPEIGKD
jgi:hypothetical protein